MCLDTMSMLYGYAETTDLWGRHYGEYGDRPAALGAEGVLTPPPLFVRGQQLGGYPPPVIKSQGTIKL